MVQETRWPRRPSSATQRCSAPRSRMWRSPCAFSTVSRRRRPGNRISRRQLRTAGLRAARQLHHFRPRPLVHAQGESGGAEARSGPGEEERMRGDQRLAEERPCVREELHQRAARGGADPGGEPARRRERPDVERAARRTREGERKREGGQRETGGGGAGESGVDGERPEAVPGGEDPEERREAEADGA